MAQSASVVEELTMGGSTPVRVSRRRVWLRSDQFYLSSWIELVMACRGSFENRGKVKVQLMNASHRMKLVSVEVGGAVVSMKTLMKFDLVRGVCDDGVTLWIRREVR